MRRPGLTLIELLVVVAMIAILTATAGAAVNAARKRAKIGRAYAEAQEITNAILAYANYTEDGSLRSVAGGLKNAPASLASLAFIVGKGPKQRGEDVPVLYNAAAQKGGGTFLDPWGHPYRVTVKKGERISPPSVPQMNIRLFFPNWHRLGVNE